MPRAPIQHYYGPCTSCAHRVAPSACSAFDDLNDNLYSQLAFRREPALTELDVAVERVVTAFVRSLNNLREAGTYTTKDCVRALSALFDYCITGIYTNNLIDSQGHFKQPAIRCGTVTATFPYTWMCPVCVAKWSEPAATDSGMPAGTSTKTREDMYLPGSTRKMENGVTRDFPDVKRLAKPGGRAIGDSGILVIKAILRHLLGTSGTTPEPRFRDGGGARGEFDLTVATDELLAFIEVKAKPLVAYPLVLTLKDEHSDPRNDHSWSEVDVTQCNAAAILLGATDKQLTITLPSSQSAVTWPLEDLASLAESPEAVKDICTNWFKQAKSYEEEFGSESANIRWHRFGCGNFSSMEGGIRVEKRVANTKELPGLDRTDDIKKGAAQVLKYSRLKFKCKKHALKSVLLGNTHALTHHEDYVEPLLHLKVQSAAPGDLASNAPPPSVWIFDAMIGLTLNHFNDAELGQLLRFERLFEASAEPMETQP